MDTGYFTTQSNLSNFHIHHNAVCIKCGKIHATMTRVGAVIFCNICVFEEFTSDDPVRQERENYLKWLHKLQQRPEDRRYEN